MTNVYSRLNYLLLSVGLFLTEFIIATQLSEIVWIRAFFGDFLVVILLYTLVKSLFNLAPRPLALSIFAFACVVEWAQYFKIADTLQLTGWARTLVGTSFSWYDILMYALGCLTIYGLDSYVMPRFASLRLTLSGLTMLSVLAFSFYQGWLHFNYPNPQRFPIHGIDVSHHQHTIDWAKLDKQQSRFVYIKATEGGDFIDPLFQQNWQQAQALQLPTGAYHYFTFCRSGLEQAQNFIRTVPNLITNLPPVIDLEPGSCQGKLPAIVWVRQELQTLLTTLQQHYAKPPILYLTRDTYELYVKGALPNVPLWARDIYQYPSWVSNEAWVLWQYDSRSRLDGITRYVDRNVFNGNAEQFHNWVHSP
jgi:lysozyme